MAPAHLTWREIDLRKLERLRLKRLFCHVRAVRASFWNETHPEWKSFLYHVHNPLVLSCPSGSCIKENKNCLLKLQKWSLPLWQARYPTRSDDQCASVNVMSVCLLVSKDNAIFFPRADLFVSKFNIIFFDIDWSFETVCLPVHR